MYPFLWVCSELTSLSLTGYYVISLCCGTGERRVTLLKVVSRLLVHCLEAHGWNQKSRRSEGHGLGWKLGPVRPSLHPARQDPDLRDQSVQKHAGSRLQRAVQVPGRNGGRETSACPPRIKLKIRCLFSLTAPGHIVQEWQQVLEEMIQSNKNVFALIFNHGPLILATVSLPTPGFGPLAGEKTQCEGVTLNSENI